MDTQVSELDRMDFSCVNGLSCIVSENQLVSMLLWCRTKKLWGKQALNPKSTGSWKLKSIYDKLLIIGSNLHADNMQQSRHNHFEQNHCLMKISAKRYRPLGCLPSMALITKEIRVTESGNKLHSMAWKYYLQQVDLVSSGQRRNLDLSVRMSGCTFPDFRRMNDSAVRDCCLVRRMMFWNRSKHSSAPKGSLQAPVQILNHRPQRSPFSWRVSWKSDCSHFQEACELSKSCSTSL